MQLFLFPSTLALSSPTNTNPLPPGTEVSQHNYPTRPPKLELALYLSLHCYSSIYFMMINRDGGCFFQCFRGCKNTQKRREDPHSLVVVDFCAPREEQA